MNKFKLLSFATSDELAHAAARAWLDEIESANRAGKPHCVALSGGRIAKKFFASTVEQAQARQISFSRVHFFWADERCVPPTDPESNFKLANKLLFAPLKITPNQIHRIRGEDSPEAAAQLASEEIRRVVLIFSPSPQRGEGRGEEANFSNPLTPTLSPFGRGEGDTSLPVLDLIFLGMGEDGHVASLFPEAPSEVLNCAVPYLAIENSPKPPPRRISLSYAAVAAARQVWVLISGAGKETALRASLRPDGQTPLARILRSCSHTKIFSVIPLD
jgi:6-phosphogluconolactonase